MFRFSFAIISFGIRLFVLIGFDLLTFLSKFMTRESFLMSAIKIDSLDKGLTVGRHSWIYMSLSKSFNFITLSFLSTSTSTYDYSA